jgi:hypothetical protein
MGEIIELQTVTVATLMLPHYHYAVIWLQAARQLPYVNRHSEFHLVL